jgi:hypothetical protein
MGKTRKVGQKPRKEKPKKVGQKMKPKKEKPKKPPRKTRPSSELLFSSLFRAPLQDLICNSSFIREACLRAALPRPPGKIPSWSENADEFFSLRASLVLEESRHMVAIALQQRQAHSFLRVTLVTHKERGKYSGQWR